MDVNGIVKSADYRIVNTTEGSIELPFVEGLPRDFKKRILGSSLDKGLVGHAQPIMTVKGSVLLALLETRIFKMYGSVGNITVSRGSVTFGK